MKKIPLSQLWIDKNEINEIKKVLDSGWLTRGPKNQELEQLISEYLGVKYVFCVSSCTTALHLAILALNVPKGEILVSDFTFPASGHAVIHSGNTPIFVDISLKDYNMNYKDLKKKITEKTRAIVVVHTFGASADMNKIKEVAKDIPIIEDAACAFGSKYQGQYCGTVGIVGCFSLHATKGIGVGEGGIVVTNDSNIAEGISKLMNYGRNNNTFENIGFNYKLSDVAAAIGVAQFKKVDKIISKKNRLAKYYTKRLKEIEWIVPQFKRKGDLHNYQSYCCYLSSEINRDRLIQIMKEGGVECQIGTFSSFTQPCYDNLNDNCITSLDIYKRTIRLPLFYKMKKEDIDFIVDKLKDSKELL